MAERSTVEVLRAARERISDPERWTFHAFARDHESRKVAATSPAACSWCALGSLICETGGAITPIQEQCEELLNRVGSELQHLSLVGVNDRRGHTATLEMFDRAIEHAEREAAA